jgi:Na+-translocating ferredoxin:NAD+ oxidoreductase RnfA subunit
LFYFALVLFAVELMNLETVIQLQKKIKIGFPAALGFVLLLLIVLFSNGLKRRFEQLMQIE